MAIKLTPEGRQLLPDVARFARGLIASKDIDPIYPVLCQLHDDLKIDAETALWHTLLYVAWYNLPSGHAAWLACPERSTDILVQINDRWPTGIERRNNRGGRVRDHLASFLRITEHTTLEEWFATGFVASHGAPERQHRNWHTINQRLQAVHGNGRWAAYKHCEILRRVHGLDLLAPDMGMRFSSGPREGLAILYGEVEGQDDATIAHLDAQGEHLREILATKFDLKLDIEELETVLCNFKSLYKGKYYVGHDIDEFQEQIEHSVELGYLPKRGARHLQKARRSLPTQYRGECADWSGVQKDRMRVYRDSGRILGRK